MSIDVGQAYMELISATDEDLMALVTTGDQAAFAELYDRMAPRVLGLIRRVLIDAAQSEEVAQELFLEVWQRAATFDPSKGKARSWILTLTHRRAVDRVRASQASRSRDEKIGIRDLQVEDDSVEEVVEVGILGDLVRVAMSALTDLQREAVSLAYFDGLTQREIAQSLSIPIGTVKTRIRDGLLRLRAQMERSGIPSY